MSKIIIDKDFLLNRINNLNKELDSENSRNPHVIMAELQILDCILKLGEEYNENEDNNALNDLFYEYSHSDTKQTFESFVVNAKGYKLYKDERNTKK